MIAKTAAGGAALLPQVLAYTSSLELDRALLADDLLGSIAHVIMLGEQGILARADAQLLRGALAQLLGEATAGTYVPHGEEDVHMAVEAQLQARLGTTAGMLHTARSRNDQVALDLRLFLRRQVADIFEALACAIEALLAMARRQGHVVLPGYTHKQRAQPITVGYLMAAYGVMLARDIAALSYLQQGLGLMPLGVGALSGTSFPIDRDRVRQLLQFDGLTANGLDTVGDRDFALDFVYMAARCSLHISRLAADVVDYASSEFGFIKLSGPIACGSSMMPQKRNPDVFELLRGKAGPATGALISLMMTLKGLPIGYSRDLQEDRRLVLEAGPNLSAALQTLSVAFEHIKFDAAACWRAVANDCVQATDLAEALVQQGQPFRTAYQAVGALVARAQKLQVPLATLPTAEVAQLLPDLCAAGYRALKPEHAVGNKTSAGGTGPNSVAAQLQGLEASAAEARALAQAVPTRAAILAAMMEVPL